MTIATSARPPLRSSTAAWIAATVAVLAVWAAIYSQLAPFSAWAVRQLPLDPASHPGKALTFFLYDTPKVLILLTLPLIAVFIGGKVVHAGGLPKADDVARWLTA